MKPSCLRRVEKPSDLLFTAPIGDVPHWRAATNKAEIKQAGQQAQVATPTVASWWLGRNALNQCIESMH